MNEGKRRSFPFKWGMGDLLVILSFGLLFYLSFHPLELGFAAAKKELKATQILENWSTSLNQKDLHEALSGFVGSVLEDRRFQLVEKEETGILLPFVPILQDLDFQYGLSLPALGEGLPSLWIAKERTGSKIWVLSDKAPSVSDSRHPQERLRHLGKLLRSSRFAAAFPRYWKENLKGKGFQVELSGILKSGSYYFVHTLLEEGGRLGIGLYAWPRQRGRDGFAAFFFHPGEGMRQTRNMVHAYEGLSSFPLPRAGLRRPSSKKDHKGEYTGLDGNTWFPIQFSR
jgi:hypothetical protein